MRVKSAAVLLLLCVHAVSANLRQDNIHSRHLLHSEHDRFFEILAAAPSEEDGQGVWRYNDAGAPLVNKDSIIKARTIEMADNEAADEAAKAAKKAAEYEEQKSINAEIVARITAPYRDSNPMSYLLQGFGFIIFISIAFYWAERHWLKEALSLPSYFDPEISKRMYPLF